MVTLYSKDFLHILITAVCFSFFSMIHRTLFPLEYSSVLQFEEDEQRTLHSTVIRILYIMAGTLLFSHIFLFSHLQIVCGVFIASFLNVWPAIVQHHLLKPVKSTAHWMLLFRYLLFVAVSVIISTITADRLIPLLKGEESIYLLDNQGISILFWFIAMLLPVSAEQIIIKYSKVHVPIRIDTFQEELSIMKLQLKEKDLFDQKNKYVIERVSRKYNLHVQWLQSILKMERYYRDNSSNRIAEYLLCSWFPNYAIKMDISLGAAQIRISTAQKLLEQNPDFFIRKMWRDDYNIDLCAQYLRSLINDYFAKKRNTEEWCLSNYKDLFDYVACQYLGCDPTKKEPAAFIYSAVLRSLLCHNIYYEGSENTENYYVRIRADRSIPQETYEQIKGCLENNGKILKEVYIEKEKTEFIIYCRTHYMVNSLHLIAENHALQAEVLDPALFE